MQQQSWNIYEILIILNAMFPLVRKQFYFSNIFSATFGNKDNILLYLK